MARITVTLNATEREALRQMAEREIRGMRDQARYLILKGLAIGRTVDPDEASADRRALLLGEGDGNVAQL